MNSQISTILVCSLILLTQFCLYYSNALLFNESNIETTYNAYFVDQYYFDDNVPQSYGLKPLLFRNAIEWPSIVKFRELFAEFTIKVLLC